MRFDIVTLFPQMFAALDCGITGRAKENNLIAIDLWNPRDYTTDNYHKVDDKMAAASRRLDGDAGNLIRPHDHVVTGRHSFKLDVPGGPDGQCLAVGKLQRQ